MKDHIQSFFETLISHPRAVAVGGAVSGWYGVDNLAHAKDAAQLAAAVIAAMVSLCALVLTIGPAISKFKSYVRRTAHWLNGGRF